MTSVEATKKTSGEPDLEHELTEAFRNSTHMTPKYMEQQFRHMEWHRQQRHKTLSEALSSPSCDHPKVETVPVAIPVKSTPNNSPGTNDYEQSYWSNCYEEFCES